MKKVKRVKLHHQTEDKAHHSVDNEKVEERFKDKDR